MNIDAESLMQEYANTVAQISARAATLAGQIGALTKENAAQAQRIAELEAEKSKEEKPQE